MPPHPEFTSVEGLLTLCNKYANEDHGDYSDARKRAKELISRMAHVVGSLHPLIEPLSASVPGAGAAIGACAVIIKLERARKENSQHMIAVCNAMTNMVAGLRHLNAKVEGPTGRYPARLFDEIDQMTSSIKEFGTFAETYYTRYARKVVRFLLSRDINHRLQSHVKSFQEHERKIVSLLAIHTTATVEEIHITTARILQRLDEAEARSSAAALTVVQRRGGETAVRNNQEYVSEVARALGDEEPLSTNMYKTLTADLEDLLEQQRGSFETKLLSAKDEIIVRLTQGPHDLLVDADVREVWRVNSWKLSVKYRVFVDSLHTHFESTGRGKNGGSGEAVAQTEPWALKVLSKVINHPAIGEAIDEDSSGFLSINEVNQFLRCKPDECSTPAWFAFWAVGWRYMNVLYAFKIKNLLPEVQSQCRILKTAWRGADLTGPFDDYLAILTKVDIVNSWVDHAGNDTDEDVFSEVDDDAKIFSETLAQTTEAALQVNLARFDYTVDDSSHLFLILHGVTTRIEQVLMLLLKLILGKHLQILGAQFSSRSQVAHTLRDMSNGLDEIFKEFSTRTRSLIRSWRSQKLDVDVQISCYAGGLLYGWYKYIMEHPQDMTKFFRGMRASSARSPSFSRQNSIDSAASPALVERMRSVEERLASMEEKMERLLVLFAGAQGSQIPAPMEYPPTYNSPEPYSPWENGGINS